MRAVYRWAALLGAGLLLAAACRGRSTRPAEPATPPPRHDPLSAFLESYAVTPAATSDGLAPRFGTRRSSAGASAIWLDRPALRPELPRPSRVLAQLGSDSALIDAGSALSLLGPGPSSRALGGARDIDLRYLGAGLGGAWFAASTRGAGDRLIWIDALGGWQDRPAFPAGLEARVASADGARFALVRQSGDDGALLFLHEPATATTRLLLPEDRPGNFAPIAFSRDGARLLLISDDRYELARLEWLDLDTGGRTLLSPPGCTAVAAHVRADGALAISSSCAGRAELLLLEAGAERVLPAPAGSRAVEAWPDGEEGWLFAVASARHPRDLWRTATGDDVRPVFYGLGPRIDPADLVEPEPVELAAPDGPVPAELWLPRTAAHARPVGAVVWIDRDQGPALWFEFEPVLQFLAQRGVAVLRLRLPGSDGFGRDFRRRGAADSTDLLERAADRLAARVPLARGRTALVAEGPRPAAVAIALSTRASRFSAIAALGAAAGDLAAHADAAATPLLVVLPPAPDIAASELPGPSPVRRAGIVRLEVAGPAANARPLAPAVAAALWQHLSAHFEGGPTGVP